MTSQEFLRQIDKSIPKNSRDLIIEFFFAFSRFEYSLKETSFANGTDKEIKPNWDKFVKSIRKHFLKTKTEELNKAVNYIIAKPPKIQAYKNKKVSWRKRQLATNEPLINILKNHICDIRNNLFHGGKNRNQKEMSRDSMLLRSALMVLNEWLNLSEEVKNKFLTPIN
jgi:hypothetical protein